VAPEEMASPEPMINLLNLTHTTSEILLGRARLLVLGDLARSPLGESGPSMEGASYLVGYGDLLARL